MVRIHDRKSKNVPFSNLHNFFLGDLFYMANEIWVIYYVVSFVIVYLKQIDSKLRIVFEMTICPNCSNI